MSSPRVTDPAAMARFCRERLGFDTTAVRLAGDASTRVYWRLTPRTGSSIILMDLGAPVERSSDPFIRARDLFAEVGLPVPRIERVLEDEGLMLLEDLGDELLQARLPLSDAAERDALYERAVEHLLVLHTAGTRAILKQPGHPASRQTLDAERFLFELRFMLEHYARGLCRAAFTSAEQGALDAFAERLAREAARFGRVLCHRDYHSRNLMLRPGGELAIVDFQDARWGPVSYDLASLLRDSYVDLPEAFVDRRVERFRVELLERIPRAEGPTTGATPEIEPLQTVLGDTTGWRRRFDLSCLQRNLKALGTFGYQIGVRGNPVYVPYVVPTSAHALRNFARFPEFADAAAILEGHAVLRREQTS